MGVIMGKGGLFGMEKDTEVEAASIVWMVGSLFSYPRGAICDFFFLFSSISGRFLLVVMVLLFCCFLRRGVGGLQVSVCVFSCRI